MAWFRRVINVFRSNRIARDIERETAFHLRSRVQELTAAGMPDRDARLTARRQFGNPTLHREEVRNVDVAEWAQSVIGDLRYAARALCQSPAFTAVAIASLAIGIGANATIFTLLDSLVLRALPVANPDQLAQISMSSKPNTDGGYFTNPL